MVNGELRNVSVEWSDQSSACVVLASEGYPGPYKTRRPLSTGLDQVENDGDLQVFHAGTSKSGEIGRFCHFRRTGAGNNRRGSNFGAGAGKLLRRD